MARRDRIDRFIQDRRNLGERQVSPDPQHQHLPLSLGQLTQRLLNRFRQFTLLDRFVEYRIVPAHQRRAFVILPADSPFVRPQPIQGIGPNRRIQQRIMFRGRARLMPPKADKGILHDIFRVRSRLNPLPGIKEKFRRKLREAEAPVRLASVHRVLLRKRRHLPDLCKQNPLLKT